MQKRWMVVFSIALLFLLGGSLLLYRTQRPLSRAEAVEHLQEYFQDLGRPSGHFSGVQALIESKRFGVSERFAYGRSSAPDGRLSIVQPFHVASVGKLFTATLVAMLVDEGRLRFEDRIAQYLPASETEGLFVVDGADHAGEVTVEQLLAHTSGVADYFGDAVTSGKTFSDLIVEERDTQWTPAALLEFSRKHQRAVAIPGAVFHYSDTGYILLGLILEKVERKAFHQILRDRLFGPLAMRDTYLLLRDRPAREASRPLADIWFHGTEVSRFRSLSADWAGGGVVSTLNDLLAFQTALHSGRLIKPDTLQRMMTARHEFHTGIHYGVGMMEIRFEEFFVLLKGLPRVFGHIGILSTHLFYDPETDTHVVMNFGDEESMEQSFRALIEIMTTLRRIKE